jgi:hypothetical protein
MALPRERPAMDTRPANAIGTVSAALDNLEGAINLLESKFDQVSEMPDLRTRCTQLRARLCRVFVNDAGRRDRSADRSGRGEIGMERVKGTVVGRIYALVGTLELDQHRGLVFNSETEGCVADELNERAAEVVTSVTDDVRANKPVPSFEDGLRVVDLPLAIVDLHAVADAINVRSKGHILLCEDASFLARCTTTSQQ